jgi:hypothetical protein
MTKKPLWWEGIEEKRRGDPELDPEYSARENKPSRNKSDWQKKVRMRKLIQWSEEELIDKLHEIKGPRNPDYIPSDEDRKLYLEIIEEINFRKKDEEQ